MAALNRDRGVGGSGYHNISKESQQSQLPSGACNFRDLSCGARAPVCGCKRFWLNDSNLGRSDQKDFCFCGHHACFHHQQSKEPVQPSVSALREEAAPHVRSRNTPEGYYAVYQAGAGASPKTPAGLGLQPDMQSQSRSINTRTWEALNGFARNQDDCAVSYTTSKLPSTAVPSVNGDFIPPAPRHSMGPPLNIPSMSLARAGLDEYMGSATEVATPSVEGTPDLHPFGPGIKPRFFQSAPLPTTEPAGYPISHPMQPPPQPPLPQQDDVPAITQQALSRDMENILQSYGRRLDVLETMSFSNVPVEEVHDKFEDCHVRLLDLEQWRSELEKERTHERELADQQMDSPKASNSKRRRLLPTETTSFSSDCSFDNAAALHTEAAVLATVATNLELEPRFEALESRVMDLENTTLPSYSRPWDVQVILLPWGIELRGIWFTTSEATQQSQRSSMAETEEWTGPQPAPPTASFRSSESTAWTTESIEAWAEDAQDWLSPKACGPSGTVYKRLASRGLIRNLTFTGSTSKHIMETINNAFHKVLPGDLPEHDENVQDYQGLREAFLPLRKVRKSTRLRFLTPAEMVTSATWTAELLESSAIMKSNGQRRLYITTPHAYLQNGEQSWTWKSLRQLPARNARGEVQADPFKNGVAIEACWSYNDKLDYVPSLHSSFGSHASQQSHRDTVETQAIQHQPMSPLSDARPLRQRTVSLPSSETAAVALKRRAASFETPDAAPSSSDAIDLTIVKRPRLTTSPEAERRGVGFTPRLSREPSLPFQSDAHVVDSRSQGATSSSRVMPRGTTPFAYATPHSNSNYIALTDLLSCGDGDTVLGTDLMSNHADDEWQGVGDPIGSEDEDEEQDASMSSDGDEDSVMEDTDADEEEGLTIYEC